MVQIHRHQCKTTQIMKNQANMMPPKETNKVPGRKLKKKITGTWKLNNTLLSNRWHKKKPKGKLESILRQRKITTQHTKVYGIQQEQF